MAVSRRDLLKNLGILLSVAPFRSVAETLLSGDIASGILGAGNFRYVYGDPRRKDAFEPFLANVFHLYPDAELHQLITRIVASQQNDNVIYQQTQQALPTIKPRLADLTYALPALIKQKHVIAAQTKDLLADKQSIDGYLEFGSSGRYLDALEDIFEISDSRYLVAERQPVKSLPDIFDRGQLLEAGEFISLDNYKVDLQKTIPSNSLDVVAIYIGFHHCPLSLRESFITTIRDTLKPGGLLVVRDHDAHNEDMRRCVALAHDVFNMGTLETWDYNAAELRNFYALQTLDTMLSNHGFSTDGRKIYQTGDPTLNALMLYRKA